MADYIQPTATSLDQRTPLGDISNTKVQNETNVINNLKTSSESTTIKETKLNEQFQSQQFNNSQQPHVNQNQPFNGNPSQFPNTMNYPQQNGFSQQNQVYNQQMVQQNQMYNSQFSGNSCQQMNGQFGGMPMNNKPYYIVQQQQPQQNQSGVNMTSNMNGNMNGVGSFNANNQYQNFNSYNNQQSMMSMNSSNTMQQKQGTTSTFLQMKENQGSRITQMMEQQEMQKKQEDEMKRQMEENKEEQEEFDSKPTSSTRISVRGTQRTTLKGDAKVDASSRRKKIMEEQKKTRSRTRMTSSRASVAPSSTRGGRFGGSTSRLGGSTNSSRSSIRGKALNSSTTSSSRRTSSRTVGNSRTTIVESKPSKEVQRQLDEFKKKIDELESENTKLKKFRQDDEQMKELATQEILQFQQKLSMRTMELENLKKEGSTTTKNCRDAEVKQRQMEVELNSLKQLSEQYEKDNIDLKVKLRSVENQMNREQQQLKMEMHSMKVKFEADIRIQKETNECNVQDMKDNHKNEVNQLKSEHNKRMEKLTEEKEKVERDLEFSKNESSERKEKITGLEKDIRGFKAIIKDLEDKRRMEELYRRKLHNTIQELKGNIRVFCRVRPVLPNDIEENNSDFIQYTEGCDNKGIEITGATKTSVTGKENAKKMIFNFDKVFQPDSKQASVFEEISQLVQSALDGYKVCIFAYGQTGSGKTFTMEGPDNPTDETQGMIPRSVEQIFTTASEMSEQGWEYNVEASFLEIYNENLRDLLCKNSANQGPLDIRHDGKKNTIVTNLTCVNVERPSKVYDLLKVASKNRKVAATEMNERSSRSHSVFQLRITGFNEASQQKTNGILNLIDLAGSERLSQSKSTGERLKETKHINSSLSCLGDVINSLSQKSKHVPFRNSKLTYYLQNCLGGDSKTLMFVNVSPLSSNVSETVCSLRFASKVNSCVIGVARRKVDWQE